ncbi:RecX family transcriptional regulator [Sphingobacterium sp. SGG-5]|uniref:regulatory protein RecX n=1 Tax=Sphingobacterium sp. SGG-5 TaxID=2710881 RepID=UPI0013EB7AE6|nr:regulatory protein RecX [Sphingobacterium sp. SGG-5]NGM61829.1 RecX family transcriptional regulator [Sphingobacterium sp. SGG-5]
MDEQNKKSKIYTPGQAKLKAENYCVYQERSQQEVRDKLYQWGLHQNEVEDIIAQLITDNFLNEERFAIAYAQGKLRMKGWGKVKIKYHLKGKRVSDPLIKIALNAIDMDEYLEIFDKVIQKKISKDIPQLSLSEKHKLIRQLQNRGFEHELIFQRIRE